MTTPTKEEMASLITRPEPSPQAKSEPVQEEVKPEPEPTKVEEKKKDSKLLPERLTPRSIAGIKVVRAKDLKPQFNMMVFGEYGMGKTLLMGSAMAVPEMSPMLVIDIEGGAVTLRDTYPDVEILRVTDWDEMQAVYDELFEGGYRKYGSIGIDSITEAQLFNMDVVMADLLENKPERDPDIADVREWQKNAKQVRKFIRGFRDLPVSTVMTALLREDPDRATGKKQKRPMLPGKLAGQVPGMYDIVGWLRVRNIAAEGEEPKEARLLQTKMTEGVLVKDRYGLMPPVMIEPTMKKIFNTVMKREGSNDE